MPGPRLWTPEDLAEYLQVQPATITRWLRSGRLHGVKVSPKVWRIPEDELQRFLERQSSGTARHG